MGVERDRMRGNIFDVVGSDPPCNRHGQECEFWDRDGYYCFLKPTPTALKLCPLVRSILALPEIAVLADDQGLPEREPFESASDEENSTMGVGYNCCRVDMAGWRKVV